MHLPSMKAARADEVWEALAHCVEPLPPQTLGVDAALGAVLAEPVHSLCDYPPFDRSVVDGYAVRAADLSSGRAQLPVLGLVRAGAGAQQPLTAGACWRINTGAPLPDGADAVVMVEDSRELPGGRVELIDEVRPEQNIERAGTIVRHGDVLLHARLPIGPGAIASLVSGGVQTVRVHTRPRVALLSTGDEIVAAGESLRAGQIFDSNSVALGALICESGGALHSLGRCPDEPAALRATLKRGLEHDLLCVVGGMSKGTHDLVPGLLEELGVIWLIESLKLKPGKPTRIGRTPHGTWVLGLAGNPVSCVVCFLLFGRGLIEGLLGLPIHRPPHLSGRLLTAMPANGAREMYQPATWSSDENGRSQVRPLLWRGSGDPFGLAGANALIHRGEKSPAAAAGEKVRFVPLECLR